MATMKLIKSNQTKRKPNKKKNLSKKRCLSRSGFGVILMDFWKENGSMLASKSSKNQSQHRRRFFEKKPYVYFGKTMILKVQGIEVWSKKR